MAGAFDIDIGLRHLDVSNSPAIAAADLGLLVLVVLILDLLGNSLAGSGTE